MQHKVYPNKLTQVMVQLGSTYIQDKWLTCFGSNGIDGKLILLKKSSGFNCIPLKKFPAQALM